MSLSGAENFEYYEPSSSSAAAASIPFIAKAILKHVNCTPKRKIALLQINFEVFLVITYLYLSFLYATISTCLAYVNCTAEFDVPVPGIPGIGNF